MFPCEYDELIIGGELFQDGAAVLRSAITEANCGVAGHNSRLPFRPTDAAGLLGVRRTDWADATIVTPTACICLCGLRIIETKFGKLMEVLRHLKLDYTYRYVSDSTSPMSCERYFAVWDKSIETYIDEANVPLISLAALRDCTAGLVAWATKTQPECSPGGEVVELSADRWFLQALSFSPGRLDMPEFKIVEGSGEYADD